MHHSCWTAYFTARVNNAQENHQTSAIAVARNGDYGQFILLPNRTAQHVYIFYHTDNVQLPLNYFY